MSRLIAIADIHGEVHKLNNLLIKLKPQIDDTVVFLGDYIDRGYYSKEVVETLLQLSKTCHCEFLLGNHCYYLLKANEGNDYFKSQFLEYGGLQTIDSYGSIDNIFKIHGDFFCSLKTYYLTDKFLFVHAGIRPDKPLEKQELEDFLFIRENFFNHKHKLKQKVIFGHTPFATPLVESDKIGIDLGVGKFPNAKLVAYICNENRFVY